MNDDGNTSPTRPDVGYKRPPREHQFKPGNKPKRKAKANAIEPTIGELLWTILQEEVRTLSNGQVRWMAKAEALCRKAYELADRDNPTMRRLIMDLMLRTRAQGEATNGTVRYFVDGKEMPAP